MSKSRDGRRSTSGLVNLMRRFNIPVTRQSYLELAYMGQPPEELSAEEEAEFPPELQRKSEEEEAPRARITYVGSVPATDPCTRRLGFFRR